MDSGSNYSIFSAAKRKLDLNESSSSLVKKNKSGSSHVNSAVQSTSTSKPVSAPKESTTAPASYSGDDHVVTEVLYRYGVVLLELLTGLPSTSNQNNNAQSLIIWDGRELKTPQDIIQVMDKRLGGQYSKSSAKMATSLAYQCLGKDLDQRTTIDSILDVMKLLKEFDLAFAAENPEFGGYYGLNRNFFDPSAKESARLLYYTKKIYDF